MLSLTKPLFASRNIRYAVVEGIVVILDLLINEYVMLDRESSKLWQDLFSGGGTTKAHEAFANECLQRGYISLEPSVSEVQSCHLHTWCVPLVVYALYALRQANRVLERHEFRDSYRRYASLQKPRHLGAKAESRLAKAERAFHLAENFFEYPGAPEDCLPRSLALYELLIYAGCAPQHQIGVRLHPFSAHAWVLCMGRPIADSLDRVRCYVPIAAL